MKVLVCVLSVIIILEGYQTKCCLESERDGLLKIKSYFTSISTPEYESHLFPSWLVGDNKSDCCEWERVNCSPYTGRVTDLFLGDSVVRDKGTWSLNTTLFQPFQELRTLNLSNNHIESLAQSEGSSMLMNLQDLDLSYNRLRCLPGFLWNLSSLQALDLSSSLTPHHKLDARLCRLRNIQELYFPSNQLNGSLPSCLWNLTSLYALDLSNNSFSGIFPFSINLPFLQILFVEDNNFHGKFSLSSLSNHSSIIALFLSENALQVEIEEPVHLSASQLQGLGLANCKLSILTKTLQTFLLFQSNLGYVDFSENQLVGSFPTWLLQNNSRLKMLYLSDNLMSGSLQLPQQKNISLQLLDISQNRFTGQVPYHIGTTLSMLLILKMSNNSFQGPIPSSLSNMTQLRILDLSRNKLSGEVPNGMFSQLSYLYMLVLSNNNLDGDIIPSNMNLSSLVGLSLNNNHFVGSVPESLKLSTTLLFLDISNNEAVGELPIWIGNFSDIYIMSLARNQFHGNIPSQILNIDTLKYLDLSENRFTGKIPPCDNLSLQSLYLHGNRLTGAIPKGLIGCQNLAVLDLANNRLSGGVPTWIHAFPVLKILLIGDNELHGELPIQLCQLQDLNIIDLSNNILSGVIPSCFQNISFGAIEGYFFFIRVNAFANISIEIKNHLFHMKSVLTENFKIDEMELIVKSRSDFYKGKVLSMMSTLDLSWNQLTGYIPPELGELPSLYNLNLSHNLLSGPIPETFSKLKSIESLDLSYNNLNGMIPLRLADLYSLEIFNVSYNNLSGEVPETGQFGSFDESIYQGNPLLCGSRLPKSCNDKEPPSSPSVELSDEEDTSFDLEVFFWSFGMSFIIVLITFGLVFYINPYWRRAWFLFIDFHLLWWLYK